jgi:hypothetical protein
MDTNKSEAIKMLEALKQNIKETHDSFDHEVNKIDSIITFINKNL